MFCHRCYCSIEKDIAQALYTTPNSDVLAAITDFFFLQLFVFFPSGIHVLTFSLTINEDFDFVLTVEQSEKYQEYKTTIEISVSITQYNMHHDLFTILLILV